MPAGPVNLILVRAWAAGATIPGPGMPGPIAPTAATTPGGPIPGAGKMPGPVYGGGMAGPPCDTFANLSKCGPNRGAWAPGTWAQLVHPSMLRNRPAGRTSPPVVAAIWPGIVARAAITGSPPGPTTPGTTCPRLTVPYPPICGVRDASVLTHPPPNPANNANVVAVRFMVSPAVHPPDNCQNPHNRCSQNAFRLRPHRNFAQNRCRSASSHPLHRFFSRRSVPASRLHILPPNSDTGYNVLSMSSVL